MSDRKNVHSRYGSINKIVYALIYACYKDKVIVQTCSKDELSDNHELAFGRWPSNLVLGILYITRWEVFYTG